ncbi:MAG: hypothetical protein KC486_02430 [Myxococcales bacterium]|nr:hypothetical protein [Myxococcales bacterium]
MSPEGFGEYGDPCESLNGCHAGLICVYATYLESCEGGDCCSPLCDVIAPNTCPGVQEVCIPWYEEGNEPQGYENVGFCGIPQ